MCDKELLLVLLKIFLNNLESNCSIYIRTLCTELKAYYFKFNGLSALLCLVQKLEMGLLPLQMLYYFCRGWEQAFHRGVGYREVLEPPKDRIGRVSAWSHDNTSAKDCTVYLPVSPTPNRCSCSAMRRPHSRQSRGQVASWPFPLCTRVTTFKPSCDVRTSCSE